MDRRGQQYLSSTGAVRLYYPDFVAIQKVGKQEVGWIIETKGREFEETDEKARHMDRWCQEVSAATGATWRYLKVPQIVFDGFARGASTRTLEALLNWERRQRTLMTS